MRYLFTLALLVGSLAVLITGCDTTEPEDPLTGPATVTGVVLDSQRGEPIADAMVTFARGNAQRQTTTDDEGEYSLDNLATGSFTVTIRAEGFLDVVLDDIEVGDGVNALPPVASAEAPEAGAYRIVLSWGEAPRDLDAHLTGPTASGSRFHVYYASRNPVDYADLDRDDVSSYGPETITVTPEVDGVYRYSVHNFSQQSEEGSQGIAGEIENSVRARVQVYSSTGLVREYRAPTPSTPGNTWRVFEMSAQGGNVTFTDVNEYVSASGAGDMNTFRLPPKH